MIEKIGYPSKVRGDLWTATEANEVKQVVNANADELTRVERETTQGINTLGDAFVDFRDSTRHELKRVEGEIPVFEESTEEAIEEMIANGTWKEGVIYYTVEE